jgi:hypothetical protein
MDRSSILGFLNPMPCVDRSIHLPIFKDEKKDDVGLHLIKFHIHVCRLRVEFPEDCLMKMFMETLEDYLRRPFMLTLVVALFKKHYSFHDQKRILPQKPEV